MAPTQLPISSPTWTGSSVSDLYDRLGFYSSWDPASDQQTFFPRNRQPIYVYIAHQLLFTQPPLSHTHTHTNMTMTLDTTQQRFGPSLNFDYSAPAQPPAFSNPWSSSSPPQPPPAGSSLFVGSQPALIPSMMAGKPPQSRASTSSTSSLASYGGAMPVPSTSAGKLPLLMFI